MEVRAYRSYVEDSSLELPLSSLAPRLFSSLNSYLVFMAENCANIIDELTLRLLEKTRAATSSDLPTRDQDVVDRLMVDCSLAAQMPKLFEAHYDLLRDLLGVDQGDWINGETVALSQVRFIRVRYLPNFLKLQVMSDVMDRQQAIELMKQYLDWMIEQSPSRPGAPQNLAELRERQIEFNLQEAGMDWISAVMGEHQYLNKVTVCRIQRILAEYGDSELMEVVACYPDFAMFRKTNDSFRLTRTQTLMTGGCCCDTCYHDVRFISNFTHPPLDVFASLSEG